jgi:protein-disulfide isomerase
MKSAETRLKDQAAQLKPEELLADSPLRGKAGSKLVLVEFSDFQCPYCGKAYETVKQFMAAHSQDVALVYKHLPLGEMHPQATNAALASWAAQQQGKFWEFHDAMFSAQDRLGEAYYDETAKRLGMDVARFDKDRASDAAKAAVQRDLDLAKKLGIQATPQFLLNSHPITGAAPLEEFEKELSAVRAEVK